LGTFGAYAATSRPVAELLVNQARPLVFSTTLPPALCAAAEAAVELVEHGPELRRRLWRNIRHFSGGLEALGHPAQGSSAIFPVVLGAAERATAAADFLRARGLLVKPIRPPSVPAGTSRLRFALSAAHTTDHLDQALAGLRELKAHGLLAAA
ncbi:MAG TPA: aminotransferase class I/II-fold pyridoxal phosphate-dependent enzyme, partial [Myxococcaceae bacterium]|nr:aminotransferase class I/II-fold pyridoxal phosphate-dependent enzyme [Myxococcaceae bacterium]